SGTCEQQVAAVGDRSVGDRDGGVFVVVVRPGWRRTVFPYTPLFRSARVRQRHRDGLVALVDRVVGGADGDDLGEIAGGKGDGAGERQAAGGVAGSHGARSHPVVDGLRVLRGGAAGNPDHHVPALSYR